MMEMNMIDVEEEVKIDFNTLLDHSLVVLNDEVNTFDWVIDTLIDVCGHTAEQAEQCTLLIHFKGKSTVKEGSLDELNDMRKAINERGIGAIIQ